MKTIYYLSDYNWLCGTIVGGGKKNHKIRDYHGNEFYVSKDKCNEYARNWFMNESRKLL